MALGQQPDPSLPPPARDQLLSSLLAGRKTLVVLDNVRDTSHVRDLVPLLPNTLVLITSRQWLTSLSAETGAERITVPPMSPSESVELLSAQLGARTDLGAEHRAGLAELCGGLPLLLTVLGGDLARKPAAGLAEYATLLDRRRLVVTTGHHGDGPTSGAACFELSYQALTPAERRLFRLLTTHPGPEFGIDAARACGGRPAEEITNTLARLTGAHLLEEADAVNRFRFHDVVREYAAYCRDRDEPAAERTAATLRVLDHYLGSVTHACRTVHRTYNPPPPPPRPTEPGAAVTTFDNPDDARSWFARERTNITSAIRYAAEHGFAEHAWRLTDPVATFFDRGGYNVDSRALRVIAVHATRAVGDREAEAAMLSGLGMVHMRLGDYAEARRTLEAALRLVVEDGPARGQASILHVLGQVALRQGETTEALELFRQGLAIDQHSGNQEGLCWAHCRLGQALHAVDQHEQALAHLNQAVWIARRIGEMSAAATSLREMGAIHRELGDLATAAAQCQQALAIAESVPDLPATAEICVVLCEINTALHRSRQAMLFGRRAVEVCEKTRDLAQHARALEVLGNVQHACGDLVDAVVAWRQAADLYEHTANAAKAAHLRGKIDAVPAFYREIVPIAREVHEAGDPAAQAWPAEDETTRPLGWTVDS
jgi:tetratricopeptide (TPR) repeat protein